MMRSHTPPTKRNKLIFLFGPTASGKTALTEELFCDGFQIINADSVQVYKGLDIGSAKPSKELMEKIPHHLVDVLNPDEQFTVGTFLQLGDEAKEKIYTSGDIPVVTGGTAYYFKHFLYGLSEAPTADVAIRAKVEKMLKEEGGANLYKRLSEVDPISAKRININDVYRITRALEVYYQSGRPLSSFTIPNSYRNGIDPLIIGLERDKDELKERIALRVELMFKEGLVDEVRRLMREGAKASWPGMQGIGYREFFTAREKGCSTISSIKSEIITNSKKYAKRQMTFFRSFPNVHWIDAEDKKGAKELIKEYLES